MLCTRLDTLHVVNIVSRYMTCPSKEHSQAMKWILRYLKDNADVGLTFSEEKLSESTNMNLKYVGDMDK